MSKVVAIASGGMDSATLLYHYLHEGNEVQAVGFDYGQHHSVELSHLAALCKQAGIALRVVDLHSLSNHLTGSSLTSDLPVPDGHYTEESMRTTVVPNRNAIMLAIAAGIAVAEEADILATGVHAGDHYIYPDCRPEFISALGHAFPLGTEGFGHFTLDAPFVQKTKAEIAAYCSTLEVPYHLTWSCYKGEESHCGRCGTCVERIEAFEIAKVTDPPVYEDTTFAHAKMMERA